MTNGCDFSDKGITTIRKKKNQEGGIKSKGWDLPEAEEEYIAKRLLQER